MTDWSKVFEVFGSGVIGVFLVMIALQVVTQLSTKIIDLIENWSKVKGEEECSKSQPQPATAKK